MKNIFAPAPQPRRRTAARFGVVGFLVAALFGVGSLAASAHVSVNPSDAASGSYSKLTFRVPNEAADASTVSVAISFPTDTPFPSLSVLPAPGWTVEVARVPLDPPVEQGRFTLDEAVDTVTWTADDGVGVRPGEFMEFSVSVGPVPEVSSIALPAVQTYSDGKVVNWDEIADEGVDAHSLDHPAPVLAISGTGDAASADPANAPSDSTARTLGLAAVILAGAALIVAVIGLVRRPSAQAGPTTTTAGK